MIAINLASRNYRLIERINMGLIATISILGFVMFGLIWTAVSQRMNSAALDIRLKGLAAEEEKIWPMLLERGQLVKDLSAMSGLLDSRTFSWTRFLSSIEAVVPAGLALRQVEFNPKDRTLTLEGTAQSPESLRGLIVGLEKSASFRDPLLKHQSLEKGNISFNVVAVYREAAGAAAAQRNK
jgi:Tfp pilus assembly protein PilN